MPDFGTLIAVGGRPQRLVIALLENLMRYPLETLIFVIVILWLLGWLFVPAVGSLVHLLLVILLVVVIIRVLQGQRPL